MKLPLLSVAGQRATELTLHRELAGLRRAASHRMWLARAGAKPPTIPPLRSRVRALDAAGSLFRASVSGTLANTGEGTREAA
ncbi:hypothetical protein BH11PSE3_BH11PSE3_15450 [soil metagenome]